MSEAEDRLPLRPVEHEATREDGRNRVLRQPNQFAPVKTWSDYRLGEVKRVTPTTPRSNRRVPDLVFPRVSSVDENVLIRSVAPRLTNAEMLVLARTRRPRVDNVEMSVLVRG